MSQPKFVFSMALIAALVMASPATGQLVEFPVLGLPSSDSDPSTTFAVQLAHGLNIDSGQNGGRGAYVIRSMQRVSFSVASGYLTDEIGEFTFGGQAAFHLAGNAEGQVSVQGGVGYLAFTEPAERRTPANDVTTWNFPIGVTFQARPSESGRIWVMPRIDWVRRSDAAGSTTAKDFAFSIGASVTGGAGFGGHLAR